MVINYLKNLAIPIISIIIMSIFLSLSNLLGFKTSNVIILLTISIVVFISSYILSKNITKKKYLHGLLFGTIISLILFILSLLFKNTYHLRTLIYYTVIILSSMFGSMVNSIKKDN